MGTSIDAATFLHHMPNTEQKQYECCVSESIVGNPHHLDADRIWTIAKALVKHKGFSAPMIAATQARKLLESGEIEERLTWMRVMAASKALLGKELV